MRIEEGFAVEEPQLFVPWGVPEEKLLDLFPAGALKHVTTGYYVADCTSLGGLRHKLGFRFDRSREGRLGELEFFRDDAPLSQTYPEWQRRLEAEFGAPQSSAPGDEGYDSHVWHLGNVEVTHSVVEHFGPSEFVWMTDRRFIDATDSG